MTDVEGSRTFSGSSEAYDDFMGRYSQPLAPLFADVAGIRSGARVLDVGCGPGALTAEAVRRVGADHVSAVDPTPGFVEACRARHPGVRVEQARAERVPFADDEFDVVAAQLVFHFVTDADAALAEMRRVTRPGGMIAACVWDFVDGMDLLSAFGDASVALDPGAPDERTMMRFGRRGELVELFTSGGLLDVEEIDLPVAADYAGFEELWQSLLHGIGPAGAYTVSLPPDQQAGLRVALFERLDCPVGSFRLRATARAARGHRPGG